MLPVLLFACIFLYSSIRSPCRGFGAHLIHGQVDACVGDDAQHVGDIPLIERPHPLFAQDLSSTVPHARVLASLTQSQTCLQHLGEDRETSNY